MYSSIDITSWSDDKIVSVIQQGNSEYFSELVNRYADKLGKYIFAMVSYNRHLADDCIQEVFLRVREKLSYYKKNTNFNAWIYRLAHNTTISFLKKQYNREKFEKKSYDLTLLVDDDSETSIDIIDTTFRKKILKNILLQVDEKYRSFILLYYYEEKSYEEIAKIMNIPINTVGTYLSRAKTKIKEKLNTDEQLFYFM